MESYLNPSVFIPILLFIAAILFYYFYRKLGEKYPRKKKETGAESEGEPEGKPAKAYEPIYAQVFDNTRVVKEWYWDTLPGSVVEKIIAAHNTLGILQDTDDNKKAYQLVRTGEEDYSPIKYPILKDDNPVDLNNDAEHWEYELILSQYLKEDRNFMQKYGMVLWWAAVIGFIIFMMVSG